MVTKCCFVLIKFIAATSMFVPMEVAYISYKNEFLGICSYEKLNYFGRSVYNRIFLRTIFTPGGAGGITSCSGGGDHISSTSSPTPSSSHQHQHLLPSGSRPLARSVTIMPCPSPDHPTILLADAKGCPANGAGIPSSPGSPLITIMHTDAPPTKVSPNTSRRLLLLLLISRPIVSLYVVPFIFFVRVDGKPVHDGAGLWAVVQVRLNSDLKSYTIIGHFYLLYWTIAFIRLRLEFLPFTTNFQIPFT